jgi:hypothetical protein
MAFHDPNVREDVVLGVAGRSAWRLLTESVTRPLSG